MTLSSERKWAAFSANFFTSSPAKNLSFFSCPNSSFA